MHEYMTRNGGNTRGTTHNTPIVAAEEAVILSKETGDEIGVYQLVSTHTPPPKTVTRDIDEILQMLVSDDPCRPGIAIDVLVGVLNRLKKYGVTKLEWPAR